MKKFSLLVVGFAAGVGLVILFMPLLTGEPRSATARTAQLTIERHLPSLSHALQEQRLSSFSDTLQTAKRAVALQLSQFQRRTGLAPPAGTR
jgi:hypothetical protein